MFQTASQVIELLQCFPDLTEFEISLSYGTVPKLDELAFTEANALVARAVVLCPMLVRMRIRLYADTERAVVHFGPECHEYSLFEEHVKDLRRWWTSM